MRESRLQTVFGGLIVAGLCFGLWQQQQVIEELSLLRTGGAPRPAAAANAPAAKAPPAVATVSLDLALTGSPVRGRADASVVLLEFSDFQCPFCGRYVRDTYPRVAADYIDTGKIRYVFRNLPLESLHPNAMNAAIAAGCSAAQGKFWEMHDRLFANQTELALPALLSYGSGLGMDEARYRKCLNGQESVAAVQADRADALKAELTGTPAFFVGRVGPDGRLHAVRRLVGAVPYSLFQSAIDEVLAGK